MIRWGVLSTAKIGREQVIPAILEAKGATLQAIASRNNEAARQLADHFGAPLSFGSYEDLLDSKDIDAVYIPLPTSSHVEWSIKAAQKGKHVLCEKPIALHADDIDKLIVVSEERKVIISEAFMVTYHPQWVTARRIIGEGKIGQLKQVQGVFSYFNIDPHNMRNKVELGGGGLPDIGVYPIVTTRFVTQMEPHSVTARVQYDQKFGTDIFASAQVHFDGFDLSFYCSTQMSLRQHMTFHGDLGCLEIHAPFNARVYGHSRISLHSQDNARVDEFRFGDTNQYKIQIEKISKAIETGETGDIFDLHSSRNNQKTIDAIYLASKVGGHTNI